MKEMYHKRQKQQLERWVEHFKEILNIKSEGLAIAKEERIIEERIKIKYKHRTTSIEELIVAINSLKNNKTPGID
jgi:hypothetical protein